MTTSRICQSRSSVSSIKLTDYDLAGTRTNFMVRSYSRTSSIYLRCACKYNACALPQAPSAPTEELPRIIGFDELKLRAAATGRLSRFKRAGRASALPLQSYADRTSGERSVARSLLLRAHRHSSEFWLTQQRGRSHLQPP